MPTPHTRRAVRHRVKWPARIKSIAALSWQTGYVLNLSVTGVLVQVEQPYEIGERVEVEIEFLTSADRRTVVAGVGRVVREQGSPPSAAIHFDVEFNGKAALTGYRASRARRASLNDFTASAI